MNEVILKESEAILDEFDRLGKFGNKYDVMLPVVESRILSRIHELAGSIPRLQKPKNKDELIQAELKRRLEGDAFSLEQRLNPKPYDFDTVVSIYGIPLEDIKSLRGWLETNRDGTLESIDRLYNTKNIQGRELGLSLDVPSVRRQSEEFASVHVQKYHRILSRLLHQLTGVGDPLRDIDVVATNNPRSYFNTITRTLAIGIPAICTTTEDGSLSINERELITLYGHEGMGHALNQVLTQNGGLPSFLTKPAGLTTATAESVAQFYQNVIFEDLRNSPETQKALGIEHNFEEIYTDSRDIAQLREFQNRLSQYAITVLANRDLGDPTDPKVCAEKVRILNEVALDQSSPFHFVEKNRNSFDSEGNLDPCVVKELVYCAQPIQRALEVFASQGVSYEGEARSKVDDTFLRGFWTPVGFVDNARLRAEEV